MHRVLVTLSLVAAVVAACGPAAVAPTTPGTPPPSAPATTPVGAPPTTPVSAPATSAAPTATLGWPTDEASAVASMLTADDLPGMTVAAQMVIDPSAGADYGFAPDPAYGENDGQRLVRQSWSGDGEVYSVDDFRWQFTTPEGAAAFLDAVADRLGGGEPVDTLDPVGENGRIYLSESSGSAGTFHNYTFVFTTGNFVASVSVSGLVPFDAESALGIARLAEARMAAAVGPR